MLRLMAVKPRVLDALVVAVVAGLLTLGALALINAMAGSSDCVSDLDTTYCYDNPGPSRGMSLTVGLVVAAAAGILRWRSQGDRGLGR